MILWFRLAGMGWPSGRAAATEDYRPWICSTPATKSKERVMSSFSTYLIGFIVLIIGLAIAAILVGVSQTWVIVGCIILIGIAIVMATTRTKTKDPPGPPVA